MRSQAEIQAVLDQVVALQHDAHTTASGHLSGSDQWRDASLREFTWISVADSLRWALGEQDLVLPAPGQQGIE